MAERFRLQHGDAADAQDAASVEQRKRLFRDAYASLTKELERAREKLDPKLSPTDRANLLGITLVSDDARFFEQIDAQLAKNNLGLALRQVARSYANAPIRQQAHERTSWLQERAEELECFCLLLGDRASGERLPSPQSVLILPDRLSSLVVLAAVASRASGILLSSNEDTEGLAVRLAEAANIPVIADVTGLFAWAHQNDLVLLDGSTGSVRINPSARVLAEHRSR